MCHRQGVSKAAHLERFSRLFSDLKANFFIKAPSVRKHLFAARVKISGPVQDRIPRIYRILRSGSGRD